MRARLTWTALLAIAVLVAAPAPAAAPDAPKPLFASDEPIHVTIRGDVMSVARTVGAHDRSAPATVTVEGATPQPPLAIVLSPRGITRRSGDICQFAPLRVDFPQKPPPNSLFSGQKRLKLVTHCQGSPAFLQYQLLEYSAYRMLNLLTPQSLRARLAMIDYVDQAGKPIVSRMGFFLEDIEDAAKRNGMREAAVGDRIAATRLDPTAAARAAVFEYAIANLDWSMTAGPVHEGCCHNYKLIAPTADSAAGIVPVPYDFDLSGFVDAPYAFPPEALPVHSVKQRLYRGYCAHNAQARAAIADLRARRGEMEAVLASLPQLEARSRSKATAFLGGFFTQTASEAGIGRMLASCVG